MNKPSNFTFENVRFSPVAFDDGKRALVIDAFNSSDVVFFRGGLPSAWYALNAGCWYRGDVVVRTSGDGRRRHVVDVQNVKR